MTTWAAEELRFANLGDARRNRRLIQIVEDLAAQPTASVPQASRDAAAVQAAYDFWKSPHVKPDNVLAAKRDDTLEKIKEHSIVLVPQDTTELNFTHHPEKKGLGYLDSALARGLKVHSVLCSSVEGTPLGLLHQKVWARDWAQLGKKHQRGRKPIEEKESYRWIEGLEAVQTVVDPAIVVVSMADQEGDIYELFAHPRKSNSELLIRAYQNRSVKQDATDPEVKRLHQAIQQVEPKGELTFELQRTPKRAVREVTLTVRFASFLIQPPQGHLNRHQLKSIRLQAILAEEENPPTGEPPVRWLLLTTLPIANFEQAYQYIKWYSCRWLIERHHFVLKSGCRIEQLQLETADRIHRALATYSIVACRLLWLTYEARHNPERPADEVFQPYEWKALYSAIHKTTVLPSTPPTLHTCMRWIAQLGGFMGRKRDGQPGIKTIWQGLRRLHDIAETWRLVTSNSTPIVHSKYVKKDPING
ncbi:MAG: IS4 family transposase [Pseudanabaenales cyanobacterium]|nr:IS4 family transposase [Pseudanabaenales cyanobacterium]